MTRECWGKAASSTALLLTVGLVTGLILSGCSDSQPVATNHTILHLSKTSLYFAALAHQGNPAQQKIVGRNIGVGTLTFTATAASSWVEIRRYTTDTIFVTAHSSTLPAGMYYDTITVTSSQAENSPLYVPVTLEVQNWLQASSTELTFSALSGSTDPKPQTIGVSSFSASPIVFQAITYSNWIEIGNPSGYTPNSLDISINITGLTSGIYIDSVIFTSSHLPEARTLVLITLNLSSWTKDPIGAGVTSGRDVYFRDEMTGWIVGFTLGGNDVKTGIIMKTTDGGETWVNILSAGEMAFGAIAFVDDSIAWVAADRAGLIYSLDSGDTWRSKDTLPIDTNRIWAVAFFGTDHGWAAGTGGVIIGTVDGGLTWTAQQSTTTFDLSEMSWISTEIGWAIGLHGTILKTTDGGNNWHAQNAGVVTDLRAVQFVDANLGWLAGSGGLILKSTDGGMNWTLQSGGTADQLQGMYWASATEGWVVGSDGRILYSNDGGINWLFQESGTTNTLFGVFFIDNEKGWVVGNGGDVLRTVSGGF